MGGLDGMSEEEGEEFVSPAFFPQLPVALPTVSSGSVDPAR